MKGGKEEERMGREGGTEGGTEGGIEGGIEGGTEAWTQGGRKARRGTQMLQSVSGLAKTMAAFYPNVEQLIAVARFNVEIRIRNRACKPPLFQ